MYHCVRENAANTFKQYTCISISPLLLNNLNFFVYSQSVHLNLQVIYNTFKLCSFDNQIIISNLVSKMNLNSKFDPVKYDKLSNWSL